MPRMIVKDKALHYAGRSMKAGEGFDATEIDAAYFRNRGRAEDAPAEKRPPAKPAEVAKPVTAAAKPLVAAPKAEDAEKPSTAVAAMTTASASSIVPAAGTYGRRDLKATE